MHTSVFGEEAIRELNIQEGGLYIDATAGEGGHTKRIVDAGGRVLALDLDESQINRLKEVFKENEKVKLAVGNFDNLEQIAKENGFPQVDGVLFDFGLSMEQVARSGRGFSYRVASDPLDMRINTQSETTAAEIVNTFSIEELYEIFAKYAEELHSQAIAQEIVGNRVKKRLVTVGDLVVLIDHVLDRKQVPEGKEPTYARIFQALRIAVNNEIENIRNGLQQAVRLTKQGGRIVIITFHSIEDRVVKQFIRENQLRSLYKNVVRSQSGLRFERSAKLRIIVC
jgi:16S rRNA (cytosine1402-N4)-methyltransferase